MPTTASESAPWTLLEELAESGDAARLKEETDAMGLRDTARALSRLDTETQAKVITTLDPEDAAEIVEEITDSEAAELLAMLDPKQAASILDAMESAGTADVLSLLPEDTVDELLSHMDPEEAEDARLLRQYEEDEAGGIMITEYLAYPEDYTVRQVVSDMRDHSEDYAHYSVQYVYVVDKDERLRGVLPLRDMLLTPGKEIVSSIMIKNPIAVLDHDSLDQLVDFFSDYGFLGVPVTDEDSKLLGIVRRGDVMEAVGDRHQSDFLKAQGIIGGEELRTMPVMTRAKRRLAWLSINIGLNFIAASIIGIYTGTLEQVIALAIFLPVISDMSGCSGNQAVAVSMRELTLGLIRPTEFFYVWLKEGMVGMINGVALGVLIACVAWLAPFGLWQGGPALGLVVGGALCLNTLVAVLLGGTIPLLLKRFEQDPALASGPILTTVTDMCGFFFVLSFATALLPYLVGGE
ncbi:MAG: magnesium transporter [Candidatus Hydrogenedens sp.]|nr:magnesium transporter [Candidatus Hydrogenedens sp.]